MRLHIDKFASWIKRPAPSWRIEVLRIVMGLAMMSESLGLSGSLDDLYGPNGFLQVELMDAVAGRSLPSLASWFEAHGYDYSSLLHGAFGLRWIFLITFTLGFQTRLSVVALWLFEVLIMASGPFSSYGVDRYFHVFLFLLLFMPVGRALSIDSWRRKMAAPLVESTFAVRVLQLALLITYLNAGLAKAAGTEWWTGDAIWRAVHMPEFRHFEFYWMSDWPLVPKILGWSTLVLETFYIFGVWVPYVGQLWLLAIVGMHVGIAALMGLVNFGVTMAFINLALFLNLPPFKGSRVGGIFRAGPRFLGRPAPSRT